MKKIAIAGTQCSGKSTVARMISNYLYEEHKVENSIVKFADPIYEVQKKFTTKKDRLFMQSFGQLARDSFGEDIFNKLLKENIKSKTNIAKLHIPDGEEVNIGFICDDARRIMELNFLKEEGFHPIILVKADKRVRRERAKEQGLIYKDEDVSENDLAFIELNPLEYSIDYIVTNNSTLKNVKNTVKRICQLSFNSLGAQQPNTLII